MTATVPPAAPPATKAPAAPPDAIGLIARKWKNRRGSLIMALHDVQEQFGYVPREVALKLAPQLGVPVARIYEVVTFYNYFKLKAPGKHVVSVCMGTACYLKGAPAIKEALAKHFGIVSGETTPDKEWHLQEVRCLGCCGLAPVVTVNQKILAKLKPEDAVPHVCACQKK